MQRRNFLRWGMASAAVTGGAACGPSGATLDPERAARRTRDRPPLSDHALERRLLTLDAGMDHVQRASIGWAGNGGKDSVDAQLFRSSMRSLLLTSSVNDLPAADRARPEVKQRLDAAAPEVDYAVFGSMDRITQISNHELADIQAALKADPGLPKQIAETIDGEGLRGGVPLRRRLHFRRMVQHVLWRMQKQSVGLVIEETLGKVQRLADRYARSAHLRVVLDPRPEDIQRWDAQTRKVAALYQDPAAVPPPPVDAAVPGEPAPSIQVAEDPMAADRRNQEIEYQVQQRLAAERSVQRAESGRKLLVTGGAIAGAGVGVALLGVGLLFVPMFITPLILFTIAGILLIVGIILMIVGAVRRHDARAGV